MRATGAITNAATGMPIPLLVLALEQSEAHQGRASSEAPNRIGGSRPGPGSAPGASWSATLDCTWGSRDRREDGRRVDGTTSYLLEGMSVVAQYAPGGQRQAWYTQSLARIDEVLSVVNAQGKFWYQTDALGSTYALANGSGQVVARSGYDVFGEPQAISGNVAQPFGFTGREHESDSGLVYSRARYLSISTGTWTQPEPLGMAVVRNAQVSRLNLFQYTLSPAMLVDSNGLNAGAAGAAGTITMGYAVYQAALAQTLSYMLRLLLLLAAADGVRMMAQGSLSDRWMEFIAKTGALDLLGGVPGPGDFNTCLRVFINCLIQNHLKPIKCDPVPADFNLEDWLTGVPIGHELMIWDRCIDRFAKCRSRPWTLV